MPERTEDRFTIEHTTGWEIKKQRINILHNSAAYAQIYIRVEGEDKEAKIWIDEARFNKRPRITIDTNKFLHMFNEDELFALNVNVKGLEKAQYFLDVNILDVYNQNIYSSSQPITVLEGDLQLKKEVKILITPNEKGSFIDKLKSEKNNLIKGAFVVNVILKDEKEEIGGNSIRIGRTKIIKRTRIKDDGEIFGVTIDKLENSYKLREGLDLMGILRVKIPIWDENLELDGTRLKITEGKNILVDTIKEVKSGDNQPEIIGVFAPRPKIIENVAEKYKLKQQVDSLDKSLSDLQSEYSSVTKKFAQG